MAGIFEPWEVKSLKAKNRLVRAATAESLCEVDGSPSKVLVDTYAALAEGGVGTIITGYCYVNPMAKPAERALNLGFEDDIQTASKFARAYKPLIDAAKENGAAIVAQLVYGGSKTKLTPEDPRHIEGAAPGQPNTTIIGPSSVENPATGLVPTEASPEDLKALAADFAKAAKRASDMGFSAVEIHGAHGYLLSQFLSPVFNRRTDTYGGSLENRARLLLEVVAAVKAAVPQDFPVFVKLNSSEDFRDPTGMEGHFSEGDSSQVAKWLQDCGVDVLEISGDWHGIAADAAKKRKADSGFAASPSANGEAAQPYFAKFASAVGRSLSMDVISTGGWRDLTTMEGYAQTGTIQGFGMSRPFIREPGLAMRWQMGNHEPSLCVECGICSKQGGIPCPYR